MKPRNQDWGSIVLITTIGVVHLMLMRGEYEEAHYLGTLFAANFVGAVAAALGIYRASLLGWMLGFFVAAGSFCGYIMSRTVGLPGMEIGEWQNPYGMLSLLLEVTFLVLVFQKSLWKGTVLSPSEVKS